MTKDQIIKLQTQLNSSGAGLKVDGIWGPKTEAAYQKSLQPNSTQPSGNSVLDLQKQLNANGAGLKEDGIWGPKTQAAYNKSLAPALSANTSTADIVKGSSPDSVIAAYLNNDWSNVYDSTGQPFSQTDQEDAVNRANAALEPYYKAQKDYEQKNTEDILKQKQLDYQNYLATSKTNFEADKAKQDQTAADTGVLFSGGRVQKLQNLGSSYEQEQNYKRETAGNSMAGTARDFQYKYGNDAAQGLSSYYKLGGNTYNPNVATGGVGNAGLSKIYNPSSSNYQGTEVNAQKAETQKRAAGLLWNKGNKIVSLGYKNQY